MRPPIVPIRACHLSEAQLLEVDHIEIRAHARRQDAPIIEAEEPGMTPGLQLDDIGQR